MIKWGSIDLVNVKIPLKNQKIILDHLIIMLEDINQIHLVILLHVFYGILPKLVIYIPGVEDITLIKIKK